MKTLTTLFIAVFLMIGTTAHSQNWTYVTNTGTTYILYGMHFPPGQNDIGYGGGMLGTYNGPGVITKTTDGGENWTQIWPTSGSIDGIQAIWFLNDTVGFAGGWNEYFIKTTDGGTTWSTISISSDVWYFTDIVFWDDDNGVASARMDPAGQAVFVTSDGGDNWTQATSGINQNVMGLDYADASTLYAVGTEGIVFKSTDGGHNWSNHYTLGAMLFGVDFADANFGVVGAEEKMFATNDGGSTWTSYTTGYEHFYATHASSNGTAYLGGTDENIYKTEDFGVTWNMEHNGPGTSSLYKLRFLPNGTGFASGSQGTIIQYSPPFGAAFTVDNNNTCEGNTVQFTDMSQGSVVSWDWTFEGGTPATSTDQNPTVTYNSAGSFDVTLEVSDGTNTSTTTETDYIFVEAIPVQANTPSGPTTTCGGQTYTYTTDPIANADSYLWEVDPAEAGSISGSGTSATFVAGVMWTGDFIVTVKAQNECGYGPASAGMDVTLNFMPTPFQVGGTGGYCEGGAGREPFLDGSETGVNYELFYEGTSTGNIMPGTGNPLYFGLYTEVGFYTVTGSTDDCSQAMYGECYIYIEYPPEQAGTPAGTEAVCNNDTTTYTSSGASSATIYTWAITPASAGVLTSDSLTVEIAWDNSFTGMAYLTVTASNDCGDGPESEELEIEVVQTPQPVVSGPEYACKYHTELYHTDLVDGNSYQWEITGGTIIEGAGTNEIIVEWGEPGMGYVTVTEGNGVCDVSSETLDVEIDDCTGINEANVNSLKVYPNPAKNVLNVDLGDQEFKGNLNLTLWDLQGKKVVDRTVDGGMKQVRINISQFTAGIYSVKLMNDKEVLSTAKVVIEK